MSGDGKPVLMIGKWLRIILLFVVLLVIVLIVLSRIPGKRPGRSVLAEMFDNRPPSVTVSELNFDVGRNRAFAHADGSVAAAGTLGIQVLGPDGHETFRQSLRMTTPALIERGGRFMAFDIGGTALRVFSALGAEASLETEFPIVSATINSKGWHCVVTQPQTGGSRGIVDVYNSNGRHVYNVIIGSGFVLSAILSDDGENLAILNIAETGSRITLYKCSSIDSGRDDPDDVFQLGNEIFLEIEYLTDTSILAFGNKSVLAVDIEAARPPETLYSYDGKILGGYTYTGSFVAVHLYDYNIGYSGQVVTFDYEGMTMGRLITTSDIASMASCGNSLILLSSDGIGFYSKELEPHPLSDGSAPASASGRVVALSEDMALTATDLSATVIRLD